MSIHTELAMETLKRAIKKEKPSSGLLLHSDQGRPFTSQKFVDFCKSQGVIQSMSKAGCPCDHAPMERF
jgi:putative transposase